MMHIGVVTCAYAGFPPSSRIASLIRARSSSHSASAARALLSAASRAPCNLGAAANC